MPSARRPGLASTHFYTDAQLKAEFVAATERNGETITGALEQLMTDYTRDQSGAMDVEAEIDRLAAEEGRSRADMTRRLLVEAINARKERNAR